MDEDLNLPPGEGDSYDVSLRQDVDCERWIMKDSESFGINKEESSEDEEHNLKTDRCVYIISLS